MAKQSWDHSSTLFSGEGDETDTSSNQGSGKSTGFHPGKFNWWLVLVIWYALES